MLLPKSVPTPANARSPLKCTSTVPSSFSLICLTECIIILGSNPCIGLQASGRLCLIKATYNSFLQFLRARTQSNHTHSYSLAASSTCSTQFSDFGSRARIFSPSFTLSALRYSIHKLVSHIGLSWKYFMSANFSLYCRETAAIKSSTEILGACSSFFSFANSPLCLSHIYMLLDLLLFATHHIQPWESNPVPDRPS